MKLKRKKTFMLLFVLVVLIGLMFFSGAIIEIFDIELSKPARVYYEPDENK
jgi:hypothetical protein